MKELTFIEKMILIAYFSGKGLAKLCYKILDLLNDLVYIHDCFICKIFKRYGRRCVFGTACFIIFLFFASTAGASDNDLITFSEICKQCTIEIVLFIYCLHNAQI